MVVDRGYNECLLQPLNASFQPFYCFNYSKVPPLLKQGIFSGQSLRKEITDVYFPPSLSVFFPSSHVDSFEVGACMESLDLYFLKFITYFLVVCMPCIFNKPFELTLGGLQQRTSKGLLSPLSLLPLSLHCILPPFHLPFPAFTIWTPSSDDSSPQRWEPREGWRQTLAVVGFTHLIKINRIKYGTLQIKSSFHPVKANLLAILRTLPKIKQKHFLHTLRLFIS